MTPKKYPQNLHTPKNIYFSENLKKYWNAKFWTQKITQAYVCMEISEYPPVNAGTSWMCNYDWSTLDIGESWNDSWFYSELTVSSCAITSQ